MDASESYRFEDDDLDLNPTISELSDDARRGIDNSITNGSGGGSGIGGDGDQSERQGSDVEISGVKRAITNLQGFPPPRPRSSMVPPFGGASINSVHSVDSTASAPATTTVPSSPNVSSTTMASPRDATTPTSAGGSDPLGGARRKKTPRKVLSAKLAKRFDKFESVQSDAHLLSPMQSLDKSISVSMRSFASAQPPLTSSPTGDDNSPSKTPKTTGVDDPRRKRRSVRKSLEDRVTQFDNGSTPFSKPRRMKSLIDRNCLLSPQEVKAIIKKNREQNKKVGTGIYQYEKTLQEHAVHLKELAAKQAAKERQRRLGNYANASFGGDPTSSEAGRKLAWQETRARFGHAVSSKKKQQKRSTSSMGVESSIHDQADKAVAAAVKLEVHQNVQAVSYDFTSFDPPSHGAKTHVQRDLIVRVVETSFAFAEFRPHGKARVDGAIDALVEAFEVVTLPIGHVLLHQDGNADDNDIFYIVETGAIDFQKDGATVGQAYVTDWFGEQALLHHQSSKLTVTVAKSTDSDESSMDGARLLRMKQKTFRGLLHVFSNQAMEERRALLNRIDFLQGVVDDDEELIDRLASIMIREEFTMNQTFYVPEATTFLIVQSGQLKATETGKDTILHAGDYRGEGALLGTMRGRKNLSSKRLVLSACSQKGVYFHVDRLAMEEILGPSRLQNLKDVRRLALSDGLLKKANISKKAQGTIAKSVVEHTVEGDTDERGTPNNVVDSPTPAKRVFEVKRSERPALYLVRQGSMKISYHDLSGTQHEREVLAGEVFGHEQLEERTLKGKTVFRRIGGLTASVAPGCKASIGVVPVDVLHDTDRTSLSRRSSGRSSDIPKESVRSIASVSSTSSMASIFIRNKLRRAVETNVGLEDLERIKMLGEGQFGEVWLVAADAFKTGDPERRQKFALKSQFKVDESRGKGAVDAIWREISTIKELDYPGIVNLVTTYEDEKSLYMLMGLIPGGELWDVIYKEDADGNWHNGIPEDHAKFYAMILADTIGYIHSRNYVYRDLKPENIMIDAQGQPVLVDFGFAKLCPDPDMTYTFVGTPNYVAPEIVTNAGHNRSVDFWAFGVTLYEMIEGENPFFFDGMSQVDLYDAICNEEHYPMQESRPPALVSLVGRLLEKDPTKRLGMLADGIEGVLRHPWFEGLDLEQLRSGQTPPPFKPSGESTDEGLEGMFVEEIQIGRHESEYIPVEEFEEMDITFEAAPKTDIAIPAAPSLDDSFASLSSTHELASFDDSMASYPKSPEISAGETTPQHSLKSIRSMTESDRRRLESSPLCEESRLHLAEDLLPKTIGQLKSPRTTPRTKKKKAILDGKPNADGKKKEKTTMGSPASYNASEFQFVKPETTYTPIRKLHKYDAEVSKIRRHNLKAKLRGMGIDSDDDDDDILGKLINSPMKGEKK